MGERPLYLDDDLNPLDFPKHYIVCSECGNRFFFYGEETMSDEVLDECRRLAEESLKNSCPEHSKKFNAPDY